MKKVILVGMVAGAAGSGAMMLGEKAIKKVSKSFKGFGKKAAKKAEKVVDEFEEDFREVKEDK